MSGRTRRISALALGLVAGVAALWLALPAREARTPERGVEPSTRDAASDSERVTDVALELDEPAEAVDPTAPSATGPRLVGAVRDDLGEPVRDFALHLRPVRRAGAPLDLRAGVVRAFRTEDGSFALDGLARGKWIAAAESGLRSADVELELADRDVRIELVVPRSARIAGRVEDADGRPIAEARVCLVIRNGQGFGAGGATPGPLATDEQGRFELGGLPPGRVTLEAARAGWASSEPLELELAPGASRDDLRLALRRPARILGRAFDDAGRPDAEREVSIAGSAGCARAAEARVRTDAEGRFELADLVPGELRLRRLARREESAARGSSPEHDRFLARLATGTHVVLREGETLELVLGGTAPPGVRVWGFVSGAAGTEGALSVELEAVDDARARRFTRVDEFGAYELLLDAGGLHTLRVDALDGTLLMRTVALPELGALRLDLELDTASVRGAVVDANGAPVDGVEVTLALERDVDAHVQRRHRRTETDALGAFAFERVEPGSYALLARPATSAAGDSAARIDALAVEPGARLDGLELRLLPAGAIDVQVVGPAGPIAGVQVQAVDANGRASEARPARVTDAGGATRIAGLTPGAWSLRAVHASFACPWSEPFEVSTGAAVRARLELVAGANVLVQVRGVREPGAWIRVLDAQGRELARVWSRAGVERPAVTLGPLPLGSFRLNAEDAHGRAASVPISVDAATAGPFELELPE